MSTFIFRFKS
jgi:hypothetical protein